MVVKKMLTAAGKAVPADDKSYAEALVVVVDASTRSSNVNRKIALEFLRVVNDSQHQDTYFRLSTSAIPGWSSEPWTVNNLFFYLPCQLNLQKIAI